MPSWLETYKPAVSSRTQLWLAAAMWSTVGVALFAVGTLWVLTAPKITVSLSLLFVALCLGIGKSFWVLDRTASRIVERIKLRGDGQCLGGFFSLRVWALVVVMMLMGKMLRGTDIPRPVLGLIYAAVGVGLLISSRSIWKGFNEI
jgi:hypothetical protein